MDRFVHMTSWRNFVTRGTAPALRKAVLPRFIREMDTRFIESEDTRFFEFYETLSYTLSA